MRLIDADALLYDFRRTIEDCKKLEKDAKDSLTKTKAEHAQQDFVDLVQGKQEDPFCRDNPDNFSHARNINGYRFESEWFI